MTMTRQIFVPNTASKLINIRSLLSVSLWSRHKRYDTADNCDDIEDNNDDVAVAVVVVVVVCNVFFQYHEK